MGLKARLPALFAGFPRYVWLDGDTGVQNARGIARAIKGADKADIAIHPQLDPFFYGLLIPGQYTIATYRSMFPGIPICRCPMINSGVFAARADSKLWFPMGCDPRALPRTPHARGRFLLHLVATGGLGIYPLRAIDNWMVM